MARSQNHRPVGHRAYELYDFGGKSCRPGAPTRRFLELINKLLGMALFPDDFWCACKRGLL